MLLLLGLCICFALGAADSAAAGEPIEYRSSFGPDGTESSDFDVVRSVAVDQGTGDVYVIDRGTGTLYKFDEKGQPVDFGGASPNVSGNKLSGLSFFHNPGESQVAVDSETHAIYVTSGNAVKAFEADGEPREFTAGLGSGTNEISGFGELVGLAVDIHGDIYASDYATGKVTVYAPTGELLTQLETSTPGNIAVAPNGTVYVVKFGAPVLIFTPSEFPVTTSTVYTEASGALNNRNSITVAVDPVTSNVYVAERDPVDLGITRVAVYGAGGTFIESFGEPGEPGELKNGTSGIGVLGSQGTVYVSTDDSTLGGTYSKVEIFGPEIIIVGPPTITGTSASGITSESAILMGGVNPNTFETTYWFEYGTSDCSVTPGSCTVIPVGGAGIGAGHKVVNVSQPIIGLEAGTTYHYRIVAENKEGTTAGLERTFTTQTEDLGFGLSDSRVWEMVSPANKFGGQLLRTNGGVFQAAQSGNSIAYQSLGSIEADPDGNRSIEPSAVLGRRSSDGWHSKDITPPHTKATQIAQGTEYDIFSPELSSALLEPRDATPLSPAASERTPYLRENSEPPAYTPLVTGKEGYANVPPGTEFGGDELLGQVSKVTISGASANLDHIALASEVPLVEGGQPNSLYEWTAGRLQPVSVLPAGEGGEVVQGVLGSDQSSTEHAISEDGSRVFWGPGNVGTGSINLTALYLRNVGAEETVRLDTEQPGASGLGENRPAFQGASADGSIVYFTDSQQLTEDASSSGRDLYRCEISAADPGAGCASLTDISAPLPASGESADVQGRLSSLSQDGTAVYFVATGVLDPAPNGLGEEAVSGEPNLYLWQEGEGVRFIARLSTEDDRDWGKVEGETPGYARLLSAAASPSGRFLSFMSNRSLTGYDNRDVFSGEPLEEAYLYDAASDSLTCISCGPSGSRPTGVQMPGGLNGIQMNDPQGLWSNRWVAVTMPEATDSAGNQLTRYPFYRPRTVLDNGRVFFNAFDSLVPADSNSTWDVYQYEPAGVGSCTSASSGAAVVRSGGACVSLMSSGADEEQSSFLDASTSGNDVFFLSAGRLSVTDEDTVYDVYDARVDGSSATLTPGSECKGETCQPAPVTINEGAPASATFQGRGNLHTKPRHHRCPKGKRKVRRGGTVRCVAGKHHRHRKSGSRAHKGREGRR